LQKLIKISKIKKYKILQEKYADAYSKNQSIKNESLKRNERIKTIETEIESWKNLLTNSEKMVNELTQRKEKLSKQLSDLENQPRVQAERKGQISENLRISDKEKIDNKSIIDETDKQIEILRSESNRLDELIETYSVFKKEELQESVLRIKKRLGPQRTKIALESIDNEKWDLVCRSVLDYYDKCYEFEKVGKTNIKFLDLTDKKYDESILELINNVL